MPQIHLFLSAGWMKGNREEASRLLGECVSLNSITATSGARCSALGSLSHFWGAADQDPDLDKLSLNPRA